MKNWYLISLSVLMGPSAGLGTWTWEDHGPETRCHEVVSCFHECCGFSCTWATNDASRKKYVLLGLRDDFSVWKATLKQFEGNALNHCLELDTWDSRNNEFAVKRAVSQKEKKIARYIAYVVSKQYSRQLKMLKLHFQFKQVNYKKMLRLH